MRQFCLSGSKIILTPPHFSTKMEFMGEKTDMQAGLFRFQARSRDRDLAPTGKGNLNRTTELLKNQMLSIITHLTCF